MADNVISTEIRVHVEDATRQFEKVQTAVRKFASGMSQTTTTITRLGKNTGQAFNETITSVGKATGDLTARLKAFRIPFQGWALSIMFFGMAIERLFMGILRKSFKVFNEVMATTQDGISNISLLSAWMQYLGFTIGNAINQFLGPFMPVLIDIIKNIAEWIELNPGLTAKIILWGIAIGLTLKLVGMLTLAVGGLLEGLKYLGLGFAWLMKEGNFIKFASFLLKAAIASIILFGVWSSDMSGVRKTMLTILTFMGLFLRSILTAVGVSSAMMGPWLLIGAIIIAIIALVVIFKDTLMIAAELFWLGFQKYGYMVLQLFIMIFIKILEFQKKIAEIVPGIPTGPINRALNGMKNAYLDVAEQLADIRMEGKELSMLAVETRTQELNNFLAGFKSFGGTGANEDFSSVLRDIDAYNMTPSNMSVAPNQTTNISIGNITLPNVVTGADDIIDELKKMAVGGTI